MSLLSLKRFTYMANELPRLNKKVMIVTSLGIGEWFMALIELHPDFKEFLRLLNFHKVAYQEYNAIGRTKEF